MLEKMIIVLSIEISGLLTFAFCLWRDEQDKKRRKIQWERRQSFKRSIEAAGQRLMAEDRIRQILDCPIKVQKEPMRKACGLFSSEEAQEYLR